MLKYIGAWLIFDGAASILNKRQEHKFLYDLGRIIRVIIGVYLFLM